MPAIEGMTQMVLSQLSSPSPSLTMPIIGRQQEQTLIRHHYEAARNGLAHVVLLSGESGIGKTRLLDEMARWASLDGATVLRGGSSQAAGMPPYLPFLEALGRYIQ